MVTRLIVLLLLASAQAKNPTSFLCEEHYQTFIKQGSITQNGRCYDVYTHQRPAHREELLCR
jgi:hypothetical protein